MHGPLDTWLAALAATALLAIVWALVWSAPAIAWRRNDLADVAWGLVFPTLVLLAGGASLVLDPGALPRATLAFGLVAAWGLRLALHIGRRFAGEAHEDRRYASWRESWGASWRRQSVLRVFVLQALIAVVVVQPLVIAVVVHEGASELGVLDLVALVLVLAGLLLESTADLQLARFRRRRAAGVEQRRYLTSGVWAWSRHPNYAGDAITWWGFGLFGIAGALDAGAPVLVVPAVVGPLVMTWLLRFGSGVALAERGRAGTPEWDAYMHRTSAFLPRPPRTTPRG